MAGTQAHNTLAAVVQQRNNAASVGWIWMRFVPSKLSIEMPLGGGFIGVPLALHLISQAPVFLRLLLHSLQPTNKSSQMLLRWVVSMGCPPSSIKIAWLQAGVHAAGDVQGQCCTCCAGHRALPPLAGRFDIGIAFNCVPSGEQTEISFLFSLHFVDTFIPSPGASISASNRDTLR